MAKMLGLRIGIDARVLTAPKCGVATYVANLVKNLVRVDQSIQIYLFSATAIEKEYQPFLRSSRIYQINLDLDKKQRKHWPIKFLPEKLKEHAIDVFHQPFNADRSAFKTHCPIVLTIHDLIPWVLKNQFGNLRKALRYKLNNLLWTRYADVITTDSTNSKNDISRLCYIKPNKISVIFLAADDIFFETSNESQARQVVQKHVPSGREYIINMAGLGNTRRNPDFILEGYAKFLEKTGSDLDLVITGEIIKYDGFYERVQHKVKALRLEDRLIVTGFLPTEEIKILLSQAKVSVVTSLYEGFCLPLLESFACEVPTIANDTSSIPEVSGGAAILVGPCDIQGLADRLIQVTQDHNLRYSLVQRGIKRVREFSWRKTAVETLDVYKSVINT